MRVSRVVAAGFFAAVAVGAPVAGQQSPLVSAPPPATVARAALPPTVIAWLASVETARSSARPGQLIVVDVSTEWCAWCRYMETQVYPDPVLRDLAADNLFVRVNPKDGSEGQLFAKRQKVKSYPTIFVFAPNGRMLQKQVGAFDSGASFAGWLRAAAARR